MQTAETILEIIRERGRQGLPLERVYRILFNPELYLLAYGKIYRNQGAMTPGTTRETVDGMSLEKIQKIIEDVRQERYRWCPARRTYIPKSNGKTRPLGIPTWSDKLLQEVIRLLLEAYYEPQFSDQSHGFRPNRGCHTALKEIKEHWLGSVWFIEGDISKCFDNIDHTILLSILREKIRDNRFLRLVENLLKAGYFEDWQYNDTHSGTPQGGIISPILANIYLDRLDQYIQHTLSPAYNRGTQRKDNPEYARLIRQARQQREQGNTVEAKRLKTEAQKHPRGLPDDPGYRRMKYLRYADDFLIGFIGPRNEAETIKQELHDFLREKLRLEMSEEKTLITHAKTETARFLGYRIGVFHNNTRQNPQYDHRRNINGQISLGVPTEVIRNKCSEFLQGEKPIHRKPLMNDTEYSIISRYQSEYRGIVQYYQLAHDIHRFAQLKWIMEQSLTKTLSHKLKISVHQVYERFQATIQTDGTTYKGLQVTVDRESQKPLVATWGGIPLKRRKTATLHDPLWQSYGGARVELLERLLAEECELCGSKENIEVHHIHALKDLQKKGRAEQPEWKQIMAARKRKTLVLCRRCHQQEIHPGRYDGPTFRK
jgi:group II intron reverse transcriptase/maturase